MKLFQRKNKRNFMMMSVDVFIFLKAVKVLACSGP